jgi:hypothetical protein
VIATAMLAEYAFMVTDFGIAREVFGDRLGAALCHFLIRCSFCILYSIVSRSQRPCYIRDMVYSHIQSPSHLTDP